MQHKFWDGHVWMDITDDEANALLNERGDRSLFVCPSIDGTGALDPSIRIITTEKSVRNVNRLHSNYLAGLS